MDETKTPTRDEIPEGDKWDLSHLFSSADKWGEDFAWIQKTYPRLTDWKGRVGESAQTLAKLLEFDKTLDLKIERVSHYASLQLAEDSANPDHLARMGQLQNLCTKIGETASFIVPEIQAIEDRRFAQFLDDPVLKEWRISLHKIRRMKPHVLSEKEERLLALGSSALDGYDDTFSQLTDVDMTFGVLRDEKGEVRPLTQSSYSAFLVKRDHGLRKGAFHQFYNEFRDHSSRVADTGSLRGDLRAVLDDVLAFNTSQQGRGIMQAVFIQRSSAQIASAVQAYWTRRFDAVGEIVRRAVARGELDADVPEALIIEMAAAPLYFRLFILWKTVDDAYLDQIVDRILSAFGAREAGHQERTSPRAL